MTRKRRLSIKFERREVTVTVRPSTEAAGGGLWVCERSLGIFKEATR